MFQPRGQFSAVFFWAIAPAITATPVHAGGPVCGGNAGACSAATGFLNFQSLGFLPAPAPTSAYAPPCRPAGGRGLYGSGNATGIFPYFSGFGYGGAPGLYATPGYYGDPFYYLQPAPVDWYVPAATNGLSRSNPPAGTRARDWVPPVRAGAAEITIRVPANADVWIEGVRMKQQGSVRQFVSTKLTAGTSYAYEIRATWTENDRAVTQKQDISVRAGDQLRLTFVPSAALRAEFVPAPAP